MKIIKFIVLFVLFVALFVISYANTQTVRFQIPFGNAYQLPLILLLFISFVIGAFLGILSMLSRVLRLRKQVTGLKKELNKSQETVSKLMATEPTTTVIVKENITPKQGI
ncbi:DUF1049 domain-containing protein [Neisseriaceae bacterium PsAf]|nr:DUF1049 domain-containing protein [Neisseriaceae bacterium PsAf]